MGSGGQSGGGPAGQKVLLGVTGGIAAYKAVYVARELARLEADVHVVMTPAAREFVGPATFAGVTGRPVAAELFAEGPGARHVELARGAALAIVAPATANSLAKLALGIADDLFSSTMLMATCPLLLAPAMHSEMWEHPATRAHVSALQARGALFVGPATGPLMSGDEGQGRMAEPEDILSAALRALESRRDLLGRRVLVTAGGTREPIDPVRYIGNRSSGLMGLEVARVAARRGAQVTLITAPSALEPPRSADVVRVTTSDEMRAAVLEAAPDADVIVKAAAVADFKPERAAHEKLKKAQGIPQLTLIPTADILAELGSSPGLRKPGGVVVGFAAETTPDPARLGQLAEEKRAAKRADLIVCNDVSGADAGFEVASIRAVIAGPGGVKDMGTITKAELAEALMDEVVVLLPAGGGRSELEASGG